jgi:hypothetical protein
VIEEEAPPRARTTTFAALLITLVCIPFVINGWELVRLAQDPSSVDTDVRAALIMSGTSGGPNETRNYAIIGATLMLGLSALSLSIALGLLRRLQGALHAGVILFAVFAFIALAASASGLASDPPAPNARLGLAVGLVNAAIVATLMTKSTHDDIEYMDALRTRRRFQRDEARAAKKAARSGAQQTHR